MTAHVTTEQVWREIARQMFAVISFVTPAREARSAGIVYVVRGRKIYFGTETGAWKTRHIRKNPHVSMTVPVPKRVIFVPWLKIPPATVTFPGTATVLGLSDIPQDVPDALLGQLKPREELMRNSSVVEITPTGDFVTYGIGVPLKSMLTPAEAAGRTPVA